MRSVRLLFLLALFSPAYTHAAEGGKIVGRVLFEGPIPVPEKIDPATDTAICSQQGLVDETLIVDSKTRGLRDAIAWIEGTKGAAPIAEKPIIDNYRCRYDPHVVIAEAGKPVVVRNRDRFLHTTRAMQDSKQAFSLALPMHNQTIEKTFKERGAYKLLCDVHSWMKGWAFVLEGEIAARTNEAGSFELTGVPAGKHTLKLWHPSLGEKSVPLLIDPKKPAEIEIRWARSP